MADTPTTYRAQNPITLFEANECVNVLIDSDAKCHNMSLLEAISSRNEVEIIKIIPISPLNCPNKFIWRCLNDGQVFVQSAYHLQKVMDLVKG